MDDRPPERILGIDPGLNVTGYGVIEVTSAGPVLCEAGVVRGTSRHSLTLRVHEIHEGISEVIAADRLRPSSLS